jgi:hypothetical protein
MMKEKILVLSTRKSIHKPIEIEIDGKIYANRPLSRATFDEVKKYEKAALEGDLEALYKQIHALFPVEIDTLNKLDIRDVNSLLDYTMARIFKDSAETAKEKAEKNAPKPGPSKSASSPASSQAS